jgi:hypothetical protein
MNIINIVLIVILCFIAGQISSSMAQEDNAINASSSGYQAKTDELVNLLVGLDNSLHVVLSIDSSGSMNDTGKTAKKAALNLLSQLEKENNGNIDVGYVAWNNGTSSKSSALSPNIKMTYDRIDSMPKFSGFTCMRRGLNESIELLRSNDVPGIGNILILISDGIDNCAPDSLYCDNIGVLNTSGINIYTIQIGNSTNGTELLGCLENHPSVDAPSAREGKSQEYYEIENYEIKNSSENMQFQANVNNGYYIDSDTNMTVSKQVNWGEYGPRITLTIKAPSVRDIDANIAIALDSSGSLGLGGRSEYGNNIRRAVPFALEEIKNIAPNSKVSIISWDDNIDFAGWPIGNTNVSQAALIPVSDAIEDINKKEVFMSKFENLSGPLNHIAEFWPFNELWPFNEKYYYCQETESTNLSLGLDSARAVLNNTLNKGDGIRKLIILITARSEFTPCNQSIINLARDQNCNIYTIGIGVPDGSLLEKELKNNISSSPTKYHYSTGSSVFYNKNSINTVIRNAIAQYYIENISNNLTIKEVFYPYIQARGDTVKAMINDNPLKVNMVPIRVNSDNTTSFEISFDENLSIKPDDVVKVIIDTTLNISLPIDVTRFRKSGVYSVSQTPGSFVSYRWLGDNRTYEMPLQECSIEI